MLREAFVKQGALKTLDIHSHYPDVYGEWFKEGRESVKSMLEIGIYKGGSLNAWATFFPNAKIFGIDVKKRKWEFASDRIKTFIGGQEDEGFLEKVFGETTFDIIIDDGSHQMGHQKKSFELLFKKLVPGGMYVIEDLHSSYWPKFGGCLRDKKTTIERLKRYIDNLNSWAYKKNKRAGKHIVNKKKNFYDVEIDSMHFYRSMCFIRRTG